MSILRNPLTGLGSKLNKNYREVKAELKGEAISRARMIKNAKDVPQISDQLKAGPPRPIPGANVKMMDNTPMTFFTDGSLRNGYGAKPPISGRQFRKLRKKIRQVRNAHDDRQARLAAGKRVSGKCDCHVGEANIAYHGADCPEFNPNGTPKSR